MSLFFQALFKAARGGEWKPDFLLVSSLVSPYLLEMMLCLPWPLCLLALLTFDLLPPNIPSPSLEDITENRKTSVEWILGDIIETGSRYNSPMDICNAVYDKMKIIEAPVGTSLFSDKGRGFRDVDVAIATYLRHNNNMVPSYRDLYALLVKLFVGLSMTIGLLYVILVLDW